jgi:Ca2+-binding RTX toxin-like protein
MSMSTNAFTAKITGSLPYFSDARLILTSEDISSYLVQWDVPLGSQIGSAVIVAETDGTATYRIPWQELDGARTLRVDDWPDDPAVRPITFDVRAHLNETADLSIDTRMPAAVATGSGNDLIRTGAGNDYVGSGAGNDTIIAGSGDDTIRPDSGNDRVSGGAGADEIIDHEGGDDVIWGGADNDWIADSVGMNTLRGGSGDDMIDGSGKLFGEDGNDGLFGSGTDDKLFGGTGNDFLNDDGGRNLMVGGAGADRFAFFGFGGGSAPHNTIRDFSGIGGDGDVIYLYSFGSPTPTGSTLDFVGTERFSGHHGEVRYGHTEAGDTFVQLDRDGDRHSDLTIRLVGHHELQASDFEFGEQPTPPIIFT